MLALVKALVIVQIYECGGKMLLCIRRVGEEWRKSIETQRTRSGKIVYFKSVVLLRSFLGGCAFLDPTRRCAERRCFA